jgi:transcriptional regulator with XRE-family HTH domain
MKALGHHTMKTAFGERVRELRAERGWTTDRLAQETSLTTSGLSDIERAISEPRLSTVLLLIESLDVSPADLLAGIPAPRKKHLPFTGRPR